MIHQPHVARTGRNFDTNQAVCGLDDWAAIAIDAGFEPGIGYKGHDQLTDGPLAEIHIDRVHMLDPPNARSKTEVYTPLMLELTRYWRSSSCGLRFPKTVSIIRQRCNLPKMRRLGN